MCDVVSELLMTNMRKENKIGSNSLKSHIANSTIHIGMNFDRFLLHFQIIHPRWLSSVGFNHKLCFRTSDLL